MPKRKNILPLLCTRGALIFPRQELTVEVGRPSSIEAVNYALKNNLPIFLTSQINAEEEVADLNQIFEYGTISEIKSYRHKDGHLRIVFNGQNRARITKHIQCDGVECVEYEQLYDFYSGENRLSELTQKIFAKFAELGDEFLPNIFETKLSKLMQDNLSAIELTDVYAQIHVSSLEEKEAFLKENNVEKRLEMVLEKVTIEVNNQIIDRKIDERVRDSIDDNQRDFYLREKLKAIKDELADSNGTNDIDDLKNKVENNPYPEHVKNKAREEINRYELLPGASAEAAVVRNYLDWLLNVPWYQYSIDNDDLNNAQEILDKDHYGLKKVKERILEYLAVKQMTGNLNAPIICLVGPPGVGKTSLAKSVAEALNRKFVKISLGGVHDEAEIRGHRRTYLGSMPGRIIQGMKKAGTINPVFLIDEIDKMASDYKGDPSSAMLEVLDPEQNANFSDHYLEEAYDLSKVLFIATANYIDYIPNELRDRLEIIELSSYTELEKLAIANEYLLPKQLAFNGLKPNQLKISDDLLLNLIRHYTREAGVRELEREIGSLCRKTVLAILKEHKKAINLNHKLMKQWLGNERYEYGTKEKKDQVGAVTGLAYTSFGGDILEIEVNYFKGKGRLIITGQLGDVMKESAEIALDYIKANANKYKIDPDFFANNDIHIHVPEGAVPKDGPSAGVTLTTALVSAITKRKARANLAMTGEVTLRGNVLPIGGLKEKTLAANRAGINTILIPKANEKDLSEIPSSVKDNINFISVHRVDEVIDKALI